MFFSGLYCVFFICIFYFIGIWCSHQEKVLKLWICVRHFYHQNGLNTELLYRSKSKVAHRVFGWWVEKVDFLKCKLRLQDEYSKCSRARDKFLCLQTTSISLPPLFCDQSQMPWDSSWGPYMFGILIMLLRLPYFSRLWYTFTPFVLCYNGFSPTLITTLDLRSVRTEHTEKTISFTNYMVSYLQVLTN